MQTSALTRRRFIAISTAASATMLASPFVRTAHSAGKLSIGLWDHWVPGANNVSRALIEEWAAREKVEVQVDYITSQGSKLRMTLAQEVQAKSGHDILATSDWAPHDYANSLEPVDDVMELLIKQNGPVNDTVAYLGRASGHWLVVPAAPGSQIVAPCSRIDLLKQYAGIDVQEMYPAGHPPQAMNWTLDTFIGAAEACHRAGFPFGIGLGTTSDSVNTAGAIFQAFGAALVDAQGIITVKTDAVRQSVDYLRRLAQFLPADASAWDDASNNKWLISGRGALIMNPPSAWLVAKRDAPHIAGQCWTHGMPSGPKGRFAPFLPFFWGIWNFSKNKPAAKNLLLHLSQPSSIERLVAASGGYDLPAFANLTTLRTWAEAGPPQGTLYHYPNPHSHQTLSIAASPAPPKIARQIYTQGILTKMVVRHLHGEPLEKTLAWTETEIDGFMRR